MFLGFEANIKEDIHTQSLSHYVKTAKLNLELPEFDESLFRDLNSFAADKVRFLSEKFANPANANLERVFAALIGPSFVGKTQSAFCITSMPVLYFPVDRSRGDRNNQQFIYRNFHNHGIFFRVAARAGFNSLQCHPSFDGIQAKDFDRLLDVELYTLGL